MLMSCPAMLLCFGMNKEKFSSRFSSRILPRGGIEMDLTSTLSEASSPNLFTICVPIGW